jgi:uncharacterized membrane-anchored protein
MDEARQAKSDAVEAVLPGEHPLRRRLSNEVHARPFALLSAPERASHLAILTGEGTDADRRHLEALCARYGVEAPGADANHVLLDFGDFRVKWERHTEFCTYTFFRGGPLPESDPFGESAVDFVPRDWLARMPGELLAAVNLVLEPRDAPHRALDTVPEILGSGNFAAAQVSGGAAVAFTDFAIDASGFCRVFVRDRWLKPRQAGRLVQRLLEIETYRMLALLAFPVARREGAALTRLGARLTEITQTMTEIGALEDERRLLEEITTLSAETEKIAAETQYRFSAARAYHALVQRRIEELREERVEGYQTFTEFVDRRLTPAMRTCEAVRDRLDTLSRRVTRASQLLRTRVDIQVEGQNRDLLASMDRRARLQLRLQETVEGLSVAAITYYAVGLVGYAAKALKDAGVVLPVDIVTGAAIPVVAGTVWYAIRRVRRMIEKHAAAE